MSRTWKHEDIARAKRDTVFADELYNRLRCKRKKTHSSPVKFCRCTHCTEWRTERRGKEWIKLWCKGWRRDIKQYLHTGEYEKITSKLGLGYL